MWKVVQIRPDSCQTSAGNAVGNCRTLPACHANGLRAFSLLSASEHRAYCNGIAEVRIVGATVHHSPSGNAFPCDDCWIFPTSLKARMATIVAAPTPINRLLAAVTKRDRGPILKTCEEVELKFGDVLSEPDEPIHHVYFPTTSFISLITPKGAAESLEVGLVGNEGVFGITLVLGIEYIPTEGHGPGWRACDAHGRHAFSTRVQGDPELRPRGERVSLRVDGADRAERRLRTVSPAGGASRAMDTHDAGSRWLRHLSAYPRVSRANARRPPCGRDRSARELFKSEASSNIVVESSRC